MSRYRRTWSTVPVVVASALLLAGAVQPGAQAAETAAPATIYGSSVQLDTGEQWVDGINRVESTIGGLGVVRIFQDAPEPRVFNALGARSGIFSFRMAPADVLAGTYDAQFRAFFAAAPKDHTTWWSYYHEIDVAVQQGRITDLAQYRAASTRIARLARAAGNPRLQSALILVGYAANPKSGFTVNQFMPSDPSLIDVVAFDNYNSWFIRNGKGYGDPLKMLTLDRDAAASVGKPFAVAEFASIVVNGDYAGRAAYVSTFARTAATLGARFASYYNSNHYGTGPDYRLLDSTAQSAYRGVMAGIGTAAPQAVPAVVATATDGGADVSWQPADGMGSPLLGYTVSTTAPDGSSTTLPVDPSATSVRVTGLTNGLTYRVQVAASNVIGLGEWSPEQLVVPGTTLSAPDAPTAPSATGSDRAATLSWTAPADHGGTSITGYTVTATDTTTNSVAGTQTVDGYATSGTVSGLVNGRPYVLSVVATNAQGDSPSASAAPVAPWAAPGAPTSVRASSGNASVVASWAPAAANGAPVTSYTLTALNPATGTVLGTSTVPGSATSGTVGGLTNGKSYAVTVTADNGATGPASARSNTVTAMTVPSMPTSSAGGGVQGDAPVSITAFWTLPAANGGSPVTGYRITLNQYSGTTVVSSTVIPVTDPSLRKLQLTGLVLKGQYRVAVQAVNAAGAGPATAMSNLVSDY